MNLSQSLLVKELLSSLDGIKNNPLLVLGASALDALFVFCYAFVGTLVSDQIAAHVVLISNQVSPMIAGGQTRILFKLFEGSLRPLSFKLVTLIFIFFVLIYLLYIALQGPAWWLASKVAGNKSSLNKYFWKFAKINLAWLVVFAVWKVLYFFFSVRYQLLKKFAPGTDVAAIVFTVLFIVLTILAFLSYTRLRFSEGLKLPLSISAGLVGLCLVFALVALFIVSQLGKFSADLGLFVSILLFPVFVLMRVYAVRVVGNVRS